MENFNQVIIRDTTLRDGLQHEEHYIPLKQRFQVMKALAESGIKYFEVGSLSHPIYLPQFKEIDDFLENYLPEMGEQDMEYTVLALNAKAVERVENLLRKGVRIDRVLTGQIATSEAYAHKNMNRSREDLFKEAEMNLKRLHDAGIPKVCANVGTIFGCPIQGKMSLEIAYEFTERLLDMGFDEIEHSDTEGTAAPNQVQVYFEHILRKCPEKQRHIFHVHDIYGMGMAGYFAAYQAGIRQFECTLGGIGGQPANKMDGVAVKGTGDYYFTHGRTGLVATEDFVNMLHAMQCETGISQEKIIKAGCLMERILGRTLDSFMVAACNH